MMNKYMKMALSEALKSSEDVPIGAVIEKDGKVLAKANNRVIRDNNPILHAEMIVISEAAKLIGNHNLSGCNLYTTLEPCPMCAGAIINSKINKLVFGASDMEYGAAGSRFNLFNHDRGKHVEVYGGIMEEDCEKILKNFFETLRNK